MIQFVHIVNDIVEQKLTNEKKFQRNRIHLCCTICTFLIDCYVCGREAPNIFDSMHEWFTESYRFWCVWRQTITSNSKPHNNILNSIFFPSSLRYDKCENCFQLPVVTRRLPLAFIFHCLYWVSIGEKMTFVKTFYSILLYNNDSRELPIDKRGLC